MAAETEFKYEFPEDSPFASVVVEVWGRELFIEVTSREDNLAITRSELSGRESQICFEPRWG